MNRKPIMGALVAAATLLAAGAYAQSPAAAPQGKAADKAEKAADKAEKAADKAEKKAEKTADKAEKAADKAELGADKAKAAEDRAARKAKEHDAQREKLKATLKGPMDSSMRDELRRHAERLARLERIRMVAQTEKDIATVDKVTSLVAKENTRHEAWITKHVASTPTPAAVNPPGLGNPAAPPPAAKDEKGGAK